MIETNVGRLEAILAQKTTLKDLTTAQLVEFAVRRGEGLLAANGADGPDREVYRPLTNDRFIVRDQYNDTVEWGSVNVPMRKVCSNGCTSESGLFGRAIGCSCSEGLWGRSSPFHAHQVVNEYAWQNLLLFVRPQGEPQGLPEFTVIAVPGLKVDPAEMGTNSEAFIVIPLRSASSYWGTGSWGDQKSIFSVMNYLLPQKAFYLCTALQCGRRG